MSDIIYLVCSTTGESTTSKNGNSNKFHKWVKQPSGDYEHTYGRVGTPGVSHVVSASRMQQKMRDALSHGYTQVEVAADVGSGAVNGPVVAKADIRQKAIDEIAGGDKGLADLVGMLVDRNTREITTGTTLKLDTATGLFKTDGGVIVTRKVVDEARVLLGKITTGEGDTRYFYILRDKDTGVDYLAVVDAGIVRLDPRPAGAPPTPPPLEVER